MPGAGTYEAAKSLVGKFSTFMLEVDDMQAVYKELSSRGVEFVDVPKKAFSGWWATVKDSEGNSIDLHQ
jgi:predicted enzyme related to lactoylglutathione lyase